LCVWCSGFEKRFGSESSGQTRCPVTQNRMCNLS
jgi:hypothetical protein